MNAAFRVRSMTAIIIAIAIVGYGIGFGVTCELADCDAWRKGRNNTGERQWCAVFWPIALWPILTIVAIRAWRARERRIPIARVSIARRTDEQVSGAREAESCDG